MRDVLFQRLSDVLGPPTKTVVKEWCWTSEAFDVMLEREVAVATAWVPWPFVQGWKPPYGELYEASRGRNRGTHRLRSMRDGFPALRLKIRTTTELEDFVDALRSRRQIGPGDAP